MQNLYLIPSVNIPPDFDGVVLVQNITPQEALALVRGKNLVSHLPSAALAEYASSVLGPAVPVNPVPWNREGTALALQPLGTDPADEMSLADVIARGVTWRTVNIFPHTEVKVVPIVERCPPEYALRTWEGVVDLGPRSGYRCPVYVPGVGWCVPEMGPSGAWGSHLYGRVVMPTTD